MRARRLLEKRQKDMKTQWIVAAGLALGLVAVTASAQVSGQGGPISVGADSTHTDEKAHIQTFDGRVEVIQDGARLRADSIKITYSPGPNGSGFGPMQLIEATGNVYYVTQDSTMKSDKAIYTKATDDMVMTGDVILTQKQNVFTGNRLVYGVTAKTSSFDAPSTGRVKAVIYPDKSAG